MKTKAIILSTLIALSALSVSATVFKTVPTKGKVSFLAKGRPALISIKGDGEGLLSQLSEKRGILSGELSFNLSSLKTGIDLRDEHLKNKYLEVSKYPKAVLKIVKLKLPESTQKPFDFTAILNLHGTEQSISGTAQIVKDKDMQNLTANFKINLSQFRIDIPNFRGVTVAEDVSVNVDIPLEKVE